MTDPFFVEIGKWERREHYRFFGGMAYPQFNICGQLEISGFDSFRRERGLPFFSSLLFLSARAANEIREFRYRIRGEEVIEHETVSPGITVLGNDETFGYCRIEFDRDPESFLRAAAEVIARAKENPTIAEDPSRDDVIYYTSIPWISFTSLSHPVSLPADSIPRISWGKYFAAGDRILLPYSVQVHHGLADGLHVGKHFNLLQSFLDRPAELFFRR